MRPWPLATEVKRVSISSALESLRLRRFPRLGFGRVGTRRVRLQIDDHNFSVSKSAKQRIVNQQKHFLSYKKILRYGNTRGQKQSIVKPSLLHNNY